jgi:sugar transferase (PEP-CTERM/EpsH1 system associated)
MRILIALSRFPYPTEKGDKVRAYYQIKELSRNNEIFLVCLSEFKIKEEHLAMVRPYVKEVNIIHISLLKRIINLFFGIFNSLPMQVNYFKSHQMKGIVSDWCQKFKIDVCYVQLVRIVENIPKLPQVVFFLDYMDAFSEGTRNRSLKSSFFKRIIYKLESQRLKNYEKQVTNRFEGLSVITEAEAGFLPEDAQNKLIITPNGVSDHFFNYPLLGWADKKYDIIFSGNMQFVPNIQAALYLVKKVLPLIIRDFPTIKICIAGVDPVSEIKALACNNVVVTGFVEDLGEIMSQSKISVAPMFSGSGLQNKLLENMAVGIPLITSPLSAAPIHALKDKHLLVASNEVEFAQNIKKLLNNEEYANELGREGQRFVKLNFRWETYNERLENAFKKLLGR